MGDSEQITLIIPRDTKFERLIRKFYKIPEQYQVDLDAFGSKVWVSIDDHKNVYEIGEQLKQSFGAQVEPLYPRLITFLKILLNNKFIRLQK
jgi:hypothetical protein